MRSTLLSIALALPAVLTLSACGGGSASSSPDAQPAASNATSESTQSSSATVGAAAAAPSEAAAASSTPTVSPTLSVTETRRAAAALATSQSATNACNDIRPFYWEIGNRDGKVVSGSVASTTTTLRYSGASAMPVASASKWIYGTYVVQKQAGVLSASDHKFLEMRSGYVGLQTCDPAQTVDQCLAGQASGGYTAAADGVFDYDGGHMEKHASLQGLGGMNNAALAAEIQSQIGSDVALAYSQPLLAGGLKMTPDAYAVFLRKMLGGQLRMGSLLGTGGAVCTNGTTCGANNAIYTPIPLTESWHYSLAHWVEDDPLKGDGAFSSGGAFGFYPWIDASKTSYGIVARAVANGGWPSAQCGRLIRKAWTTGVAG